MSNTGATDGPAGMSREELMSALFANMILQNSNMAMIFLGKAPHPETGQASVDIETAKMFIDQLEMIEARTKGNLTKDEERLLQQSLMHLRMTFVEVVQQAPAAPAAAASPAPADAPAAELPKDAADAEAESRKKFSKKY